MRLDRLRRSNRLLLDLSRRRDASNAALLTAVERMPQPIPRQTAADFIRDLEAERGRIARDLHDTAGQSLAGILLQLELAGRRLGDHNAEVSACLARCRSLAAQALDQIRRTSHMLHPPDWKEHDLRSAVESLVADMGLRETLQVEIGEIPSGGDIPSEIQTVLYRSLQEGLTNVVRHAGASAVSIRMPALSDGIALVVEDNGRGFDVAQASAAHRGIGLAGIRRRVESVGGSLLVRSRPGHGCRLSVVAPVAWSST